MLKQACLLTGAPGSGKTFIIKEALTSFQGKAGGFYSEEIRVAGVRQGFRIVTLNGDSATLAHIDSRSPFHVSKYGVDVSAFDRVGVDALRKALREENLLVIDEIGKMEFFSPAFREVVDEALESGKRILGTIMLKPHPWADRIKAHSKVQLLLVTRANREQVLAEVCQWLKYGSNP